MKFNDLRKCNPEKHPTTLVVVATLNNFASTTKIERKRCVNASRKKKKKAAVKIGEIFSEEIKNLNSSKEESFKTFIFAGGVNKDDCVYGNEEIGYFYNNKHLRFSFFFLNSLSFDRKFSQYIRK